MRWTVLWSGVNRTKTRKALVVTVLSPVSTSRTEVDIVDDYKYLGIHISLD